MKHYIRCVICLLLLGSGCATHAMPRLQTPEKVDLERYMGTWHSIASIPKSFEEGCRCTRAEYSRDEDGTIRVVNSCIRDGERDAAEGEARLRSPDDPSRLEVSFFGPFWGEYTIIYVSTEYELALVGTRDRDSLWLLSRTKQISDSTLEKLKAKAKEQGFDTSRLEMVDQDCG